MVQNEIIHRYTSVACNPVYNLMHQCHRGHGHIPDRIMKWLRLSERTKDRLATLARFIVIVPMLSLGNQLWGFVHAVWAEHWLRKDAQPMSAIVMHVHPKGVLNYRYTVNGKDYTGKDSRAWEEDRDRQLAVGEQTTAFVSASHPSLSSLRLSGSAWIGLPIVIAILVFELFLLAVLVDGILRLFFGIQIHTGQPEDSVVVLIFAGASILFLAFAALALRRNRFRQIRIFTTGRFRREDPLE